MIENGTELVHNCASNSKSQSATKTTITTKDTKYTKESRNAESRIFKFGAR